MKVPARRRQHVAYARLAGTLAPPAYLYIEALGISGRPSDLLTLPVR